MTSTQGVVPTQQREQWVDALRVVLISGVIVVHTATAYVTDFPGYHYGAPGRNHRLRTGPATTPHQTMRRARDRRPPHHTDHPSPKGRWHP